MEKLESHGIEMKAMESHEKLNCFQKAKIKRKLVSNNLERSWKAMQF